MTKRLLSLVFFLTLSFQFQSTSPYGYDYSDTTNPSTVSITKATATGVSSSPSSSSLKDDSSNRDDSSGSLSSISDLPNSSPGSTVASGSSFEVFSKGQQQQQSQFRQTEHEEEGGQHHHNTEHAVSVLAGGSPLDSGLALFLLQISLIMFTTKVLAGLLGFIHQPRVIAEVLAGLILGPSVCGYIPGWLDNVFPPSSLPGLTLIANLGLILFMFLIGMELDPVTLFKGSKQSILISFSGILFPVLFI